MHSETNPDVWGSKRRLQLLDLSLTMQRNFQLDIVVVEDSRTLGLPGINFRVIVTLFGRPNYIRMLSLSSSSIFPCSGTEHAKDTQCSSQDLDRDPSSYSVRPFWGGEGRDFSLSPKENMILSFFRQVVWG